MFIQMDFYFILFVFETKALNWKAAVIPDRFANIFSFTELISEQNFNP